MTKLSEVLGGIVKDIAEAQVSADMAALGYLEQYQKHELLKHMDVPRVSVNNLDLNLKFAIESVGEFKYTESAVREADIAWAKHIHQTVLLKIAEAATQGGHDDGDQNNDTFIKATQRLVQQLRQRPGDIPSFHLQKALEDQKVSLLNQSVNYVSSLFRSIVRRGQRPSLADIKRVAKAILDTEFEATKARLKNIVVTKSASEMDIHVLIDRVALSKIPEEHVHELRMSINMDYIPSLAEGEETSDNEG